MVTGLQKLYQRAVDNLGWPRDPLKLVPRGCPPIHELLKRLGVINSSAQCLRTGLDFPRWTSQNLSTDSSPVYNFHDERSSLVLVPTEESAYSPTSLAWNFLFRDDIDHEAQYSDLFLDAACRENDWNSSNEMN